MLNVLQVLLEIEGGSSLLLNLPDSYDRAQPRLFVRNCEHHGFSRHKVVHQQCGAETRLPAVAAPIPLCGYSISSLSKSIM